MASNVIFIGNENNSNVGWPIFTFVSNKPHPEVPGTCTLDFVRTVQMYEMASDGIMLVSIGFSNYVVETGIQEAIITYKN